MSTAAGRGPLLITPLRAPELLFGLGPIEVEGDTAHGSMRTAAWMTDPSGRPSAGMLGVLVDDVVGQATLTARPDGCWPVTTELSIDVLDDLPTDGTRLRASSELLVVGAQTAVARGEVRHPSGRLLAVATVATRYAPGVPDPGERVQPTEFSGAHLLEVVGGVLDRAPDRRPCLRVPPGPLVENATGRGHGGVVAGLSEVAAAAAVDDPGRPTLRTCGLRVAYLRPVVLDAPLVFRADVVHRGRTTALTRVDVTGGNGRVCASATVTATQAA